MPIKERKKKCKVYYFKILYYKYEKIKIKRNQRKYCIFKKEFNKK